MYEPNGWNVIERNDVFWNNYNYFLAGAAFHTVSERARSNWAARPSTTRPASGSSSTAATTTIVRGNNVFGNYKWGIASFSGPGETVRRQRR